MSQSGGNTGRGRGFARSSNNGSPKKDNEPDKSKGLSNHIFNVGKSEDCQKINECLMSHKRQNCDNRHDIAPATENGKKFDFDAIKPMTETPKLLKGKDKEDPIIAQAHAGSVKSVEMACNAKTFFGRDLQEVS